MAVPAPSSCSDSVGLQSRSLRSDSLVGSLCREIDRLGGRWRQLAASLERCHDPVLVQRLRREGRQLQHRRLELLEAARGWRRRGVCNSLAIEFLIEVASRPLGA